MYTSVAANAETKIEVWRSQLANNVVRHCGCADKRRSSRKLRPYHLLHLRLAKGKNGEWKRFVTGELYSYFAMMQRCYAKKKNGEHVHELHGGKGIRVCDRWFEPRGQGFKNFLADMGPRPSCTTLDRLNPQDHYTPLNCKWGTPKEQAIHKTHIMWKDETPPPIPSIQDANEQIDDIFGSEPY
jgi:hypothetical protein